MRPPSEVRLVLRTAALELTAERGAFTWRELAEHTQVGYEKARSTVQDMRRAGELQPCGQARSAHSTNWVTLYEASAAISHSEPSQTLQTGLDDLGVVVLSWAREG